MNPFRHIVVLRDDRLPLDTELIILLLALINYYGYYHYYIDICTRSIDL